MHRRVVLPLLTLAVLGTCAAHAKAANVSVENGVLAYVAAPGERNNVRVSESQQYSGPYAYGYAIQEFGSVTIVAGANCGAEGNKVAKCDAGRSLTSSIVINLGDGDDQLGFGDVCFPVACVGQSASRVPTTIDAGPGKDVIDATPVSDAINVRDGEADAVTCGDGNDTVVGDEFDTIAADCEQVDIGVPNSPAGPAGVSINGAAQYTNDPKVTLSLRWPRLASRALLSNDGGFFALRTVTVAPTVSWTLDSSGPERLPKTVYVRFTGGASGPETYQDDIILDETDPVLQSATLAATASASAAVRAKRYTLRLKAKDATSGVSGVQVALRKSKPGAVVRYKRTVRVSSVGAPKYVRVIDRAGNRSAWRTLTR